MIALIAVALLASLACAQSPLLFERLSRYQDFRYAVRPGPYAGDLNGDGHLDGVSGWQVGEPYGLRILLGDGQGGQPLDVSAQKSPLGGKSYFQLVFFPWADTACLSDINRDGFLDYIVARCGANPTPIEHYSGVFLNDGTGLLRQAHGVLPLHVEYHGQVYVFDANTDRWPDLLLIGLKGLGESRLYFSSMAATRFIDATFRIPRVAPGAIAKVAPVDVDLDGDVDLVLAMGWNLAPQPNLLWVNDGKGNFSTTTRAWPVIHEATNDVEVGDVDGDGDPDIVFCNGWKGGVGYKRLLSPGLRQ
jgi:hypothetical protein